MKAGAGHKAIVLNTFPGKGMPLVESLFSRGLKMVDLQHARGSFPGGPVDRKGDPVQTEIEIVTCVVEESVSGGIFSLIHELAGLDKQCGGFMYMRTLNASTTLNLPDKSAIESRP
ncbi:MAG: hypothetical protein KKH28_01185 [Elusimicrobia bacterium]|nr:hypothetical protein [Elusimicrobiota bacterium]